MYQSPLFQDCVCTAQVQGRMYRLYLQKPPRLFPQPKCSRGAAVSNQPAPTERHSRFLNFFYCLLFSSLFPFLSSDLAFHSKPSPSCPSPFGGFLVWSTLTAATTRVTHYRTTAPKGKGADISLARSAISLYRTRRARRRHHPIPPFCLTMHLG